MLDEKIYRLNPSGCVYFSKRFIILKEILAFCWLVHHLYVLVTIYLVVYLLSLWQSRFH